MKIPLKIAFSSLILIFSGCFAEPEISDLDRVKRDFLTLRFIAPFDSRFRDLNDEELFELSCRENRLKCQSVITLLETEDPQFYSELKGNRTD